MNLTSLGTTYKDIHTIPVLLAENRAQVRVCASAPLWEPRDVTGVLAMEKHGEAAALTSLSAPPTHSGPSKWHSGPPSRTHGTQLPGEPSTAPLATPRVPAAAQGGPRGASSPGMQGSGSAPFPRREGGCRGLSLGARGAERGAQSGSVPPATEPRSQGG